MKRKLLPSIVLSILSVQFFIACDLTEKTVEKDSSFEQALTAAKDTDGDGLSDEEENELGTNPNHTDSDNDGLTDGDEVNTYKTNPLDSDTDKGGVSDGNEVQRGTDPLSPKDDISTDSDNDGLTDSEEKALGTEFNNPDSDGDGLNDGAEVNTYKTDPLNPDSDAGGVTDGNEVKLGLDPSNKSDDNSDFSNDQDKDGLTDEEEKKLGTDPDNPDTDSDGLTDGHEVNTSETDPLSKDTDNGGANDGIELDRGQNPNEEKDDNADLVDNDSDGLNGHEERENGTNPNLSDTDEDGLSDGLEVNTHKTSPINPDSDKGGINDGHEVSKGNNPLDPNDDIKLMPLQVQFESTPLVRTYKRNAEFLFSVSPPQRVKSIRCSLITNNSSELIECDAGVKLTVKDLSPNVHSFKVDIADINGQFESIEFSWEILSEKDACNSELSEIIKPIIFEKDDKTCEWEKNGNLAKRDVHVQAKATQSFSHTLPLNSKLCELEVNFDAQKWKFDDHFVLSINNIAIATNAKFLLSDIDGKKIFDFDKVKGKKWSTQRKWCFTSECKIPSHDKQEDFSIAFDRKEQSKVTSYLQKSSEVSINLDIIGDNDNSDCKQSGISGELRMRYAPTDY